jgi:tripartite-type tricarboxylate transporter receptor subunit TctC
MNIVAIDKADKQPVKEATMMSPGYVLRCSMALLSALTTGVVHGQDYPSKPIRVFASGVGGSSDLASRLFAPGLSAALGQQVIVDSRAAPITIETVAKAPPDGYTLITAGSSFITAHLLQPTPYDPLRDFAAVTLAVSAPSVVTAHPTLPVKSIKELIALAKARPNDLNYASGNTGAASHLAGELFKSQARITIVRVPYKVAGEAVADMITGQVHVAFYSPGSVMTHVKSGKLKALAVTSVRPSALVPGLPTVADTGLPGYEVLSVDSVYVPANTPTAIVNRLNQELVRVLTRPEIKEKFLSAGGEVVANTPEELAAWLKSEVAKWSKVIKDAGIKGN